MLRALLLGACVLLTAAAASAVTPNGAPSAAAVVPVLAALDRVIQVLELHNATPRDAVTTLGRTAGIRVIIDASVPRAPLVTVNFRGTRVGDALTILGQSCGLHFLPGSGALVVAAAPNVTVNAGPNQPATVTRMTNPWTGWSELTGLPLVPGGDTGYPSLSAPGAPGAVPTPPGMSATIPCARCRAPMLPTWAFCPHCGQQRLVQQLPGKFCPTCGRPHEAGALDSAAGGR